MNTELKNLMPSVSTLLTELNETREEDKELFCLDCEDSGKYNGRDCHCIIEHYDRDMELSGAELI